MKRLNNNILKTLSVAVVAVLVTACDGGTSKSSNAQSTPPGNNAPENNLNSVVLNHDNFSRVAGQSLKSLLLNEASANALNKSVVITTDRINPMQDSVTGVVITIRPFQCRDGGSTRGNLSLVNSDGSLQLDLSKKVVGTLNANFDQCNEQGFGLNGEVSGTLSGNISQNLFETNLDVTALEIQQPDLPGFTFDGTFNYRAFSNDFESVTIEVSSSYSLYFADDAYTQFDLAINKTVNNSTGDYSYQVESEFTDSLYPDSYVAYRTLQPLTGTGFSLPTGGEVAVSGDNGTIYVYPLEEGNLRLELDLDDDGVIDDTQESTWEDLVLRSLRNE